MPDTKPFWQSKTLLGILLLLLPAVAKKLGFQLDDADAQDVAGLVVQGLGALIGAYGRFTAKHDLSGSR